MRARNQYGYSDSLWPQTRVEQLRALAAAGFNGTQIAVKLETTRRSIIGKAWREGIRLGAPGRPKSEPAHVGPYRPGIDPRPSWLALGARRAA